MTATDTVRIFINRRAVDVPAGTSVAAAMAIVDMPVTRSSVSGAPRAPLCGMGICQECRVRIGARVRLACQTVCEADMQVERLP